jgi:hypothetical protein
MKIKTWPTWDGENSQREANCFDHVNIQELLHFTTSVAASAYQQSAGVRGKHYEYLHI